jgi:large repetitive protein
MSIKRLLASLVVVIAACAVLVTASPRPAAASLGVPSSVSSSNNPSNLGQSVTFTVSVDSPFAVGLAFFFDGASPMNAGALLTPDFGGFCGCIPEGTSSASFSTSSLSGGTHLITAAATGTPFGTTLSDPIIQTVRGTTTTTSISADPSPPTVFGQGVTFTASVTADDSSAGTPTGSVQFTDNGANIGGSVTLVGGTASVTSPGLTVGTHTIGAAYTSDDSEFLGGSGSFSQEVDMASTSTGLTSSANASVFGQPITLSANVGALAPGAGTPTGTVTFADGATTLGTAVLSGGAASTTTAGLSVGGHSLTVSYSGDGNFKSSIGTLTQTVNQAPTSTTVVSSANPSVFGQKVTFNATVCPSPPSSSPTQLPSGTVTFTADGASTPFDTELISPTSAPPGCESATSTAVGSFSVATHAISVSYQGDGNFLGSSGPLVGGQVVNKAPTATALNSVPNPSFFGDGVTLTATVTVPPPGAGVPTGTVTFSDGATVVGSSPLSPSGTATLVTAGLQVGTHALAATYSGDGNFLSSTSAPVSQLVRCMTVLTGRINGRLTVTGSTCINDATVNGGITVQPGAALSLTNSTVNGAISSSGAKALTYCADTHNGASSISGTIGFVLIGDNGDHGFSCGGSVLHGGFSLTGNKGQLELGGNQISGGVSVSGTSGSGPTVGNATSEIEGNHISGSLSCSGNTPPPSDNGHPNQITGGRSGQCGAPNF